MHVDPLVISGLLGGVLAVVTVAYGRQAYTAQYQTESRPSFGLFAIALCLAVNPPEPAEPGEQPMEPGERRID